MNLSIFNIFTATILTLLVSCGKKNTPKSNGGFSENPTKKTVEKIIDADGDLLADVKELEFDRDPLVAEVPTLSISKKGINGLSVIKNSKEVFPFTPYKKIELNKKNVVNYLSSTDWHKDNTIYFNHIDIFKFDRISSLNFYHYFSNEKDHETSPRLVLTNSFSLKIAKGMNNVKDLEIALSYKKKDKVEKIASVVALNFNELKPKGRVIEIQNIHFNFPVDRTLLEEISVPGTTLFFSIENFTFTIDENVSTYKNLLASIKNKTQKIYFDNGYIKKTDRIAHGADIKEYIKKNFGDIELGPKGSIYSIDGFRNKTETSLTQSPLTKEDLSSSRWFTNKELEERIGKVSSNIDYFLVYEKLENIASKTPQQKLGGQNFTNLDSDAQYLRVGDTVKMTIQKDKGWNVETEERSRDIVMTTVGSNGHQVNEICTVYETTILKQWENQAIFDLSTDPILVNGEYLSELPSHIYRYALSKDKLEIYVEFEVTKENIKEVHKLTGEIKYPHENLYHASYGYKRKGDCSNWSGSTSYDFKYHSYDYHYSYRFPFKLEISRFDK